MKFWFSHFFYASIQSFDRSYTQKSIFRPEINQTWPPVNSTPVREALYKEIYKEGEISVTFRNFDVEFVSFWFFSSNCGIFLRKKL